MRIVLAFLACSVAVAQEFEVASIKSAAQLPNGIIFVGGARGGPGTNDPTHIVWSNATLFQILQRAYSVKDYQIEGPDWLRRERYEIAVGVPEGAPREQVAMMWRNLLASRFGVTVHKIQKEFPVDELLIGPRGHKLKENNDPLPEPGAAPLLPPPPPGPDGKINLPSRGLIIMMRSGPTGIVAQATGRAETMDSLATMLGGQVGHPVVDKTGLSGRYDFTLEYAPDEMPRGMMAAAPAAPPQSNTAVPVASEIGIDLAGAIQQQLGLKLVKGKGMLDVIIVDKAEKVPTEN